MLKLLSPGDLIGDALGLGNDEHRVIFRMFINTLVWGLVATALAFAVASQIA